MRVKFSEVIGHSHLKSHLQKTLEAGRIPHAQLFSGAIGTGLLPMALAYASEILNLQFDPNSEDYRLGQDQVSRLEHPDLHLVFPVNTTEEIKKDPVSDDFILTWRQFILENPYGSLYEWLKYMGIEKKQGNIATAEAEKIAKKLRLKSFKGGYKVMLIWMADNMNDSCANKILKIIEEPEDHTVLILLAEKEENLLTTIRSRLQTLQFPPLSDDSIATALEEKYGTSASIAHTIASRARGDFNLALQLISDSQDEQTFEAWFIEWVRTAFKARGNKQSILPLLKWSETIAAETRETQRKFLMYCSETFRQALLENYGASDLVYFQSHDKSFRLSNFAPFVHQNNIQNISQAIEEAIYHIGRSANAKILFSDLSMNLTRFIHAPKE